MTTLNITELTTGDTTGNGVFDVLLKSVKAHLDQQFTAGRIKGPEYATVYLGSLDLAMQTGLAFVLQQRKNDLEAQLLEKQILQATAQTALVTEQTANAVLEGLVLTAQKCKLQAEFDLLQTTNLKAIEEKTLLVQKTLTEKAQITSLGVDADSVVGRQKQLYQAQTGGFARDSELKVAQTLIATWNVRRTTDEATIAGVSPLGGVDNGLGDGNIARAVNKLLAGIGA